VGGYSKIGKLLTWAHVRHIKASENEEESQGMEKQTGSFKKNYAGE